MASPVFLDPAALDFSRVIRPPSSKMLETCDQFVYRHGKLYRLVGMEAVAKSQPHGFLAKMESIWTKTKKQAIYIPASCGLLPNLYASFYVSCIDNQEPSPQKNITTSTTRAGRALLPYSCPPRLVESLCANNQECECLKYDAENNEPGALYLLATLLQQPEKSHYLLKAKQARQPYSYQDYESGRELEKDPTIDPTGEEMIRSYESAVKHHHPQACYRLGLIYRKRHNHARALKLFKKAANCGFASAQFQLAIMYERGQGVPQDYREAIRRYAISAGQGEVSAMHRFCLLFRKKSQEVPLDEQVKYRYYERSWEYLEKAAKAGIKGAQFQYGMKLLRGPYHIAAEWLKKAADQGHVKAMYRYGLLCVQHPTEFPLSEGIPYLYKAAEKGEERAQRILEEQGYLPSLSF